MSGGGSGRLKEHRLTLNPTKCDLGKTEVDWFGFIFSKQGMSVDLRQVEAINRWSAPKDKKAVKSVLQTV